MDLVPLSCFMADTSADFFLMRAHHLLLLWDFTKLERGRKRSKPRPQVASSILPFLQVIVFCSNHLWIRTGQWGELWWRNYTMGDLIGLTRREVDIEEIVAFSGGIPRRSPLPNRNDDDNDRRRTRSHSNPSGLVLVAAAAFVINNEQLGLIRIFS